MAEYDHDVLGVGNPQHPANQEELPPLTELEEAENWNMELCAKIALLKNQMADAKKQLEYCIEIAEQGTNTLLLNNLLKIKL